MTHTLLEGSPYRGYVYAYPHKTAYRPLPPTPLADLWAHEAVDSLSLYVHVPFCTMRCGFCNLFTTPNPNRSLVSLYLEGLRRQAEQVKAAIPGARFSRFAIGGGTPTFLDERELAALFDLVTETFGVDSSRVPTGIEVSPDTISSDKVRILLGRGVERFSIGIQSFVEAETSRSGRPQKISEVEAALDLLARCVATLNVDLIYGLPGQSVASWLFSLGRALAYEPAELYLYPLYVRPLTGLGRSTKSWDDLRLECYREARDLLLDSGYEQVSMRMFRRGGKPPSGPAYCCQDDGMVGLGCGARSYTRDRHYSLEYAVGARDVKAILADYLAKDADQFAVADFGFDLDDDERRRRYLIQSILRTGGLNTCEYASRFGSQPEDDFPDLRTMADLGLLGYDGRHWKPTDAGLERSDVIGPHFFSDRVRRSMAEYEPR